MGLDITAHRGLIPAPEAAIMDEDARYRTDVHKMYLNPDFPGRADDITHRGFYRATESFRFRAGSYGGYNRWRDQLAELAGYPAAPHPGAYRQGEETHAASVWADPKPGPFVELINFSDCEGTIGTAVSMKLALDFADFQEKADAHPDEYFREKYAEWRKAFELAAQDGAVEFH